MITSFNQIGPNLAIVATEDWVTFYMFGNTPIHIPMEGLDRLIGMLEARREKEKQKV